MFDAEEPPPNPSLVKEGSKKRHYLFRNGTRLFSCVLLWHHRLARLFVSVLVRVADPTRGHSYGSPIVAKITHSRCSITPNALNMQ